MGRGGLKAEFWCEGIFLWFSAGRNFGLLFFRFWLCGRRSMVFGVFSRVWVWWSVLKEDMEWLR